MSKKQKLLQKLLRKPKDLRFEELERIIIMFGYRLDRSKGSHFSYLKDGRYPLVIPKHSPVKRNYINDVLNAIEDDIEEFL